MVPAQSAVKLQDFSCGGDARNSSQVTTLATRHVLLTVSQHSALVTYRLLKKSGNVSLVKTQRLLKRIRIGVLSTVPALTQRPFAYTIPICFIQKNESPLEMLIVPYCREHRQKPPEA